MGIISEARKSLILLGFEELRPLVATIWQHFFIIHKKRAMAVNRLTKHLNVNASRLLEEHQVKYENKTKHAGRRIRLTYMVEASGCLTM